MTATDATAGWAISTSSSMLFGQTDEDGHDSLWSVKTDGSAAQLLVSGTDLGAWLSLPAGS
jgi:hypothetical protein